MCSKNDRAARKSPSIQDVWRAGSVEEVRATLEPASDALVAADANVRVEVDLAEAARLFPCGTCASTKNKSLSVDIGKREPY